MKIANLCTECSTDFASVAAFDRHRVGATGYSFAEGMCLDPAREDGRRCMDEQEMERAGLVRGVPGRWGIESDSARIRDWRERQAA